MSKSVLISGIGIAGPTLAYWLSARGFQPVLIEHAPALREDGYVIDFWGLGYDIAERMGLIPAIKAQGYNVQELRFVNDRGRRVGGFDVDVFRALTDGRYVSLARSDLARLIYDRIADRCETIFGDRVAHLEQFPDGVEASFERMPARRFDLAIGADGLHSTIRKLIFGSEGRFEKYLGYMAAAFEARGYRPRDEDVYVCYGAPGKQVGRFALRDDRTLFLFVFAADRPIQIDPGDLTAQKKALRAAFDDLGWELRAILAALDACDEVYFDEVSQIRMESWSQGRVALVGDAAFAPSLLAGQGSALAMTAAYVLANELARSAEAPAIAFRRYEQLLRNFLWEKQNAAEGFATSFAPKTRFGLWLRNQVTKAFLVPGAAKFVLGATVWDRLALPDYSEALAGV